MPTDHNDPQGDGLAVVVSSSPLPARVTLTPTFDPDTGEWPVFSDEDYRLAQALQQRVQEGMLQVAVAIYHIREGRLHLALGATSWTDYVDRMLPFGERQVQRLLRVGEAFGRHYLPAPERTPVSGSNPTPVSGLGSERAPMFEGVGLSNLYELTRLPEDDRAELLEQGTLTAPDGTVYTWEDVQRMGRRKLEAVVKEKLAPYKAKLELAHEATAEAEVERDALAKALKEQSAAIAAARDLEDAYRGAYSTLAEKTAALGSANATLDTLASLVGRIGVTEDDPTTLQHDLVALLDKLDLVRGLAFDNYAAVRAALAGIRS